MDRSGCESSPDFDAPGARRTGRFGPGPRPQLQTLIGPGREPGNRKAARPGSGTARHGAEDIALARQPGLVPVKSRIRSKMAGRDVAWRGAKDLAQGPFAPRRATSQPVIFPCATLPTPSATARRRTSRRPPPSQTAAVDRLRSTRIPWMRSGGEEQRMRGKHTGIRPSSRCRTRSRTPSRSGAARPPLRSAMSGISAGKYRSPERSSAGLWLSPVCIVSTSPNHQRSRPCI